jgi:putative sigma-54 modulation protein
MDLIVKGRGVRVTEQVKRAAQHKLAKTARLYPRVLRLEVEIIDEGNPRIDGGHRVAIACHTARRVFRAEGSGRDVEAALDQVVERLERQMSEYKDKVRNHRHASTARRGDPTAKRKR